MKTLLLTVFFFSLFAQEQLLGQTVNLSYKNKPLNQVLLDLTVKYKVHISINSDLSTTCPISIRGSFNSMTQVLDKLAGQCGLEVVKIKSVYAFYKSKGRKKPVSKEVESKKINRQYSYKGNIKDYEGKALQGVRVLFQNKVVWSDENGFFSLKGDKKNIRLVFEASYYRPVDTLVKAGGFLQILLRPKKEKESELEVHTDFPIEYLWHEPDSLKALDLQYVFPSFEAESNGTTSDSLNNISEVSANSELNYFVALNSSDTLVRNIKWYPGLMASNEVSSDYSIWGSYDGQTYVSYGGMTLFGSGEISENVGKVNPLMIEKVKMSKGVYQDTFSDRIGGVIVFKAKPADYQNLKTDFGLLNKTAMVYSNIPLFKHTSALQVSARKTYNQAFYGQYNDFQNLVDAPTFPYTYSDLNVKFSTLLKDGDSIEFNSLFSKFQKDSQIYETRGRQTLYEETSQSSSLQTGLSLKYVKNWKNGGVSTFSAAQTWYSPLTNFSASFQNGNNLSPKNNNYVSDNQINEFTLRFVHNILLKKKHNLELGGAYQSNESLLDSSFEQSDVSIKKDDIFQRFTFYVYDKLRWAKKWSLKIGAKTDVDLNSGNLYFQPGVNIRYTLSQKWSVHSGVGIYNQFISQQEIIDEQNNVLTYWKALGGVNDPVLTAQHFVLGLGYVKQGVEFSLDAFYKNSTGMNREYVANNEIVKIQINKANASGIDFYFRKKIRSNEFWIAYSLSQVEETFKDKKGETIRQEAPQSQQHELKLATVFQLFKSVHLSFNYIYGSGFANNIFSQISRDNVVERTPYSRFDATVMYDFRYKKLKLQAGLSFLNLFDTNNVRLYQAFADDKFSGYHIIGTPSTTDIYLRVGF